ncbi:MAG: hypothetical protein HRT56_03000, partial [Coraliomargarita sp.]|nr:hypothetical protein [Coraliomargarita sp.]
MKKNLTLATIIGLITLSHTGMANRGIEDIQSELKGLRAKDQEIGLQKKEIQKKIHAAEAEILIIKNQEAFTAAVESLNVQHPTSSRRVLIYSRTTG